MTRRTYARVCNDLRAGDAVIDAMWDAGLKDHAPTREALDTLLAGRLTQRQRYALGNLIEAVATGAWEQARRVLSPMDALKPTTETPSNA